MPDTKSWNPYAAAAAALTSRKDKIDQASEEKSEKKDERTKKAGDDPERDPAEEKELTKSTPRLRDYRIRKSIGSSTPAEVRLYELQEKRVKSYKKGTKRVLKTGLAYLHKGEAVLSKKDAKRYRRGGKVSAAASSLGAGKKKSAKKEVPKPSKYDLHEAAPAPPKLSLLERQDRGWRSFQERKDLEENSKRLTDYRKKHGSPVRTPAEKRYQDLYDRAARIGTSADSSTAKKSVPGKTKRLIQAAGKELKSNPPKVLKSTMHKKGSEAANKQRIAIMLSKARAAGADIPKKG